MKQTTARKSLLAIITIFTVIVALLVPAPVYAAGPSHEPPPPKPPTNDLGNKGKSDKGSSSSVGDLPADTTVVVTSNGTSQPLASQLSIQALSASAPSAGKSVKFCKKSNQDFFGDCTSYSTIQDAIDAVANMRGSATGTFYVAVDYPTSVVPPFLPAIVLDQGSFFHPDGAADIRLFGGYNFSGKSTGTLGSEHPTQLDQPLTILNINDDSSLWVSNFAFNVSGFATDTSATYPPAVVQVIDSNHVSLWKLTINNSAPGDAVDIENSGGVDLFHSDIYQTGDGNAITINNSNTVALNDVNVDQQGAGDGISIADSGVRADPDFLPGHDNAWKDGVSLYKVNVTLAGGEYGIDVFDSDHISIKNTTVASSLGVPIAPGVSSSPLPSAPGENFAAIGVYGSDYLALDNVVALGGDNGDGIFIQDTYNTLMNKVIANSNYFGAYLLNDYGPLEITNSHFDQNGLTGLFLENYVGDVHLANVTANLNGFGTSTSTFAVDGFLPGAGAAFVSDFGSLTIDDSQFDNNQMAGLWVTNQNGLSTETSVTASDPVYGGDLTLNRVEADSNGVSSIPFTLGWGANISMAYGNVFIADSHFDQNAGIGLMVSTDVGFPAPIAGVTLDEVVEGNISLYNVTANQNYGPGAVLATCNFGSVDLTGAPLCNGHGSISVTGEFADGYHKPARDGSLEQYTSQFDLNGDAGLIAYSANDIFLMYVEAGYNYFAPTSGGVIIHPLLPTTEKAGAELFAMGNQFTPAAADLVDHYTINMDRTNFFGNDGDGVFAAAYGNMRMDEVFADLNDGVGAYLDNCLVSLDPFLHCTTDGMIEVVMSGFDANTAIGLLGLSSAGVYTGGSEASGNNWAGAVLASPETIAVTGSQFNGLSDYYDAASEDFTPHAFWQPLGLAVVTGSDAYLGKPKDMPFFSYLPKDYGARTGVEANGNLYAGAVILSGLNALLGSGTTGVASLDTLNGLFASSSSDSFFGSAYVSHSNFDDNGYLGLGVGAFDNVSLDAVTANENGLLGSLLLAGSTIQVDNSSFNDNGYLEGTLPGEPLPDLLRDGVIAISGLSGDGATLLNHTEANGNLFAGAVALSPIFVGVSDGQFNGNGAGGLLAASLGDVVVVDSQANANGYVGAVLAAINLNDVLPTRASESSCLNATADFVFGGYACASGLEASGNGFLGAAVVGTQVAEVDDSTFTANDWLGPFSLDETTDLFGGGLVAVGGSLVNLNDVHADENFGFGAGAFNGGGILSMFSGMLGAPNAILSGLAPSAYALDLSDISVLPIFNQNGTINVADSSFSGNEAWGLLAVLMSSQGSVAVGANPAFSDSLDINVGNFITLDNVDASHNGEYGIVASITSLNTLATPPFGLAASVSDDSVYETFNLGNFISLHDVSANENGIFGIEADITDISAGSIPLGFAQASPFTDKFHLTQNVGNFISMDGIEANGNGDFGIIAEIEADHGSSQTMPGLAETPAAAGFKFTSSSNYLFDLNLNAGNFINLDHVSASGNDLGGIVADIAAAGFTESDLSFLASIANSNVAATDSAATPGDGPISLTNHVTITALLNLTSGNQINLGAVDANENGLIGVMGSIESFETRTNNLTAEVSDESTNAIEMGSGKASLVYTLNEIVHANLTSGDQINIDGLDANGNGVIGLQASIASFGNALNDIEIAPVSAQVLSSIDRQNGTSSLSSRGTLDLQANLLSGQQINLDNVNTNGNITGILASINAGSSALPDLPTVNTIDVALNSMLSNSIEGETGNASATFDWDNILKANIFSGAQINLDGVQSNDNTSEGVAAYITSHKVIVNTLFAQLGADMLSSNSASMVSGTAKVTATLNNLMDTNILSGNQINLQDVDANRNSTGACLADDACGMGSGITADIYSTDTIQNILLPILAGDFIDFAGVRDGHSSQVTAVLNNAMAASIHSGDQISLDSVAANKNGGAGIDTSIESISTYLNFIAPTLSFRSSQVAIGGEGSTVKVGSAVNNSLQILFDSGNGIFMQDVSARSNGGGGVAAGIDVGGGDSQNILAGGVGNVTIENVALADSGKATLVSDLTNQFGVSLFNGNTIALDGMNASYNGGSGVDSHISEVGMNKINEIIPLLLSNSSNQVLVDNGKASLTANEENNLWGAVNSNNTILLTDVAANVNGLAGVTASINSAATSRNEVIVTLQSVGSNFAGIQTGAVTLTSNLFDSSSATVLDENVIALRNLAASRNGLDGVNAQITSANVETNSVYAILTMTQDNEISYKDGVADLDASILGNLLAAVDASNFIEMDRVTANLNGGNGVVASVISSDTLGNYENTIFTFDVNSIINQDVSEESLDSSLLVVSVAEDNTTNMIDLDHVTANHNTLSGTVLSADNISVTNSTFMYNGRYGLELTGDSSLINDKACHNVLGPLDQYAGSLFTLNFDSTCGAKKSSSAGEGGEVEPEVTSLPWQIINVYMEPGKNGGTLSCQFGTTYLYLESQTAPSPDFEWARTELSPCIAPSGSVGTFVGLAQGALPGPLPDGVTFQGKAFDFSITGESGSPVALGGAMNVRFTLPGGFSLPAGKKLAILWFDPTGKKWVELTTYAGSQYVNAYASSTGAFVLVIE